MTTAQTPLSFEYPHLSKIYNLIEQRREIFFRKITKTLEVMNRVVNSEPDLFDWYKGCIEEENTLAFDHIDPLKRFFSCTRTLQNNCSTVRLSFSFLLVEGTLLPCITKTQQTSGAEDTEWEQVVAKENMPEPNFKVDGYIPLDCIWLNTFCESIQDEATALQILKQFMYFKINQMSQTQD